MLRGYLFSRSSSSSPFACSPADDAAAQSPPANTVTIRALNDEITEGDCGRFLLSRPFAGGSRGDAPSSELRVQVDYSEACYSYCVADGHILQGDYFVGTGVQTTFIFIPAGKYHAVATFSMTDDEDYEWDDRVIVTATVSSNITCTTFTVRDNDQTTGFMRLYPQFERRTVQGSPGAVILGTDTAHRGNDYRILDSSGAVNTGSVAVGTNYVSTVLRIEIMDDDEEEDRRDHHPPHRSRNRLAL